MNDPADNDWEPTRLELEQHERIAELTAENAKLRELLGECFNKDGCVLVRAMDSDVIDRIKAALATP